jgi:hypothetical protein
MIQYTEDRYEPIHMSLEEALQLQEKLSKAILMNYSMSKKFANSTEIINMPMTKARGDKHYPSGLNFVIEGN